jgi:hypothetical protein
MRLTSTNSFSGFIYGNRDSQENDPNSVRFDVMGVRQLTEGLTGFRALQDAKTPRSNQHGATIHDHHLAGAIALAH